MKDLGDGPGNGIFNAIPPGVSALAVLIFGVELMFQLAEAGLLGPDKRVGFRIAVIADWGVYAPVLDYMIENHVWPLRQLARFVVYPFIHGGFLHALIATAMLLALGRMVGQAFGSVVAVAVFMLSAVAGALAYALALETRLPLFGAFPGIYGLIGGYSLIMWHVTALTGEPRWKAFQLILMLAGLQLVFALIGGAGREWVADLVGFATGFALTAALSPAGRAAIRGTLARLRRR